MARTSKMTYLHTTAAVAVALLAMGTGCADVSPDAPRATTTTTFALTATVPGDFSTIQAAIDAAGTGDVVQVAPGTYEENLTLKSGVTVMGSGMATTTVYGTVSMAATSGVTISDLTLRGDLNPGSTGITADDATFTVRGVTLREFELNVDLDGTSNATFQRSQLRRGKTDGLLVQGAANVTLTNTVLSTNYRDGLRTAPGASGTITVVNSLFWGNGWPSQGAGLMVQSGTLNLTNTIVTSNRRGLDCGSACPSDYNIIWGNFDDYVGSAAPGSTNRSLDPKLTNLNEGDFTLLAGSPAIDNGTASPAGATAPDQDYFGGARPSGSTIDIGPHEYPQDLIPIVVISEIMANPFDEGSGEFVELHNPGSAGVDVSNWVIDDGDSTDFLRAWAPGGTTVIPPGGFAIILDPDYDDSATPTFAIAPGAVWLTLTGTGTIGNGLSTGDPVKLSQGQNLIDSYSFPFNPANGVSVEKGAIEDGDVWSNWIASPCGSSPGGPNCAWGPPAPTATAISITEMMANPITEKSGEYIELYNGGDSAVDVAGWTIDDGDSKDTLAGWQGGSTSIPAGAYAVVLDPDYADDYTIDGAAVLLTLVSSTTLGNGLSTNDPMTLSDSTNAVVSSFSYPFDAGNGVSVERTSATAPDVASSWRASTCTSGGSPGSGACVSQPPSGAVTIAITEVMANALTEDTDEFVELYNFGTEPVDLAGWTLSDGDKTEALTPTSAGGTMVLQPGAFALVMDSEYPASGGIYSIPAGVLRLRTPDSSIASGLATTDPITLFAADGATVATMSSPFNPGNGVSAELVDLLAGDVPSNWVASSCGASPGALNCAGGPIVVTKTLTPLNVVINEVMANPLNEGTGEFVEIFNAGDVAVDLTTLTIAGVSAVDALVAYNAGPTVLQPGAYGVIIDSDYAGEYSFGASAVIVTTTDKHIDNGLAVTEMVTLSANGGADVLSTYGFPFNPGNGTSVERSVPTSADSPDTWVSSNCASGSSPGGPNCTAVGGPASGTVADGLPCAFGSGDCAGGVCLSDALTDVALCASDCSADSCGAGFLCVATGDANWAQVCWPEDGAVDPGPTGLPSLLLSEIVVRTGAAEFIELHNPNAVEVSLDHVYLADYADYHGITSGSSPPISSDFRMGFPTGATIAAGEYVTVSLESAGHFESVHGLYPDYDTWPSDPNAPSMQGQIGSNAGLSNGAEMVVLFYWDGASALVTDLDYVVYGNTTYAMDKTGITVGSAAYKDQVAAALQQPAAAPGSAGASLEHCDLLETGQTVFGGNGANGEDHTSEPFASTWQVVVGASPGAAPQACAGTCTPVCNGNCGGDGCGGSCGSCGGGEYCEVDTCLPIATGLTLEVVKKGWNGWKLPEGFGTTHTLLMFTNANEFTAHFGVEPPSEADFGTENVVFFSAGSAPLTNGANAVVTEVVDNNTELFVFTTFSIPQEDCIGLNLPVPVWNMYTVTKPVSGATALTEIYGEDEVWCGVPGSSGNGGSCGPTQVCGEDFVCAGLTYGGDGNCNPKSMWGTFYGPTPTAIPDSGSVTLPLVVSTMASVEVDVVLYVDITHSDPSQLTVTMLNPLNEEGDISQSATIFDQVAGSGPNLLIHRAVLGFSGDEVANGEWALVVEDHSPGGTGTVNVLWMEMTSRWD